MTSTTTPLLWAQQQNFRMNGIPLPTNLPIGVVSPIANQQQSVFQPHLPLLNGIQWPTLGLPQKNIFLSPTTSSAIHLGMQLPGLEQPSPTNSANGKNDEENLPAEEKEKLKIKREKNALASRKCRQNKIRQIQHWKTQAELIAHKLNANEAELRLVKARHQALLLHLQRTGTPVPPQFASGLLPTSPETSVEETLPMIQPNHVIRTDESHANTQLANSLPNINTAINLSSTSPPTDQMALLSITEHNKTVKELIDTALASGSPLNYQTHLYALKPPGDQQSTPTSSSLSSTLTSSTLPSTLTSSTLPSTLTSPTQATRILSSPPSNSDSTMKVDVEGNDDSEAGDEGDFSDRPTELSLENPNPNPMVLGMRTTLLTPTLCMTVDTSSQKALYNQPTGLTPVITTKIIFSPTSLPLMGNSQL
uniref:BZIP domain-containing protein n=1 Tax=Acrobeloides nanus TaxID=290746 RepID=A0A914EGS5_9BILA